MLQAFDRLAESISTREKILRAAREVFERNGTRGTTTREIAETAGVNEATIFRHFGNKMALLEAMREWSCDAAGLTTVTERLSGEVAADLKLICRGIYEGILTNRAIIRISLAEEATDPDSVEPTLRGPRRVMDNLIAYLQGHIDAGTIRGNATQLTAMIMGMMFALAMKSGRLSFGDEGQPEKLIPAFVDTILNGAKS